MNINELEKIRKSARNKIIMGIVIVLVVAAIVFFIFRNDEDMTGYSIIVLMLGIVIVSIATKKSTRKFTLAFKDAFVLKALSTVLTNLTYEPESGLDEHVIADTGMMNMGDRYSSNDFVSGKYKNISVLQADVHIQEEHESTDSDGHTHTTYVTIFQGRWMVFDFNKEFKANVQVCSKRFSNAKANRLFGKSKYTKVSMEDQEFNNKFKTLAQNQHDAFYILTPHLMERIKKLSENIKSPLLFCFVDNKLHVGIQNNKDSFEHSVFKKINEEQETAKISGEVKEITNFIDELNLDNDLFRKGV